MNKGPRNRAAFIVWKKYQRRVEVLAPYLDSEPHYYYHSWEEKSRIHKAFSYMLKSIDTFKSLIRDKPPLVFVQFPPAPALYCVALYSFLTGSKYVSDCHLGLTNERWLKWVHAKKLLAGGQLIVHNEYLVEHAMKSMNARPFVLRDGVAKRPSFDIAKSRLLDDLGLRPKSYVIFPCSYSSDEPLDEVFETARILPAVQFVLTWHFDRLSTTIRNSLPSNVKMTGYLEIDDFNQLFASAGVALVLTKHEAVQLSGMQEAMAFQVPAVVSDLKTTRALYKDYPVYVRNDPGSIANGVRYALENRHHLEEKMKGLRIETEKDFLDQIATLRAKLGL